MNNCKYDKDQKKKISSFLYIHTLIPLCLWYFQDPQKKNSSRTPLFLDLHPSLSHNPVIITMSTKYKQWSGENGWIVELVWGERWWDLEWWKWWVVVKMVSGEQWLQRKGAWGGGRVKGWRWRGGEGSHGSRAKLSYFGKNSIWGVILFTQNHGVYIFFNETSGGVFCYLPFHVWLYLCPILISFDN